MKKLYILSVIVFALICWVISNWGAWFHEYVETKFQLMESVIGVQLTVGNDPINERIISWRSRPDSLLLEKNAVRLIWMSDVDTIYPEVNKKWIKSQGGEAIYFWSRVDVEEGKYNYAIETIEFVDSKDTIKNITPYYSTKVDYSDSIQILVIGDVQDFRYNPETDSAVRYIVDNYEPDFILQLGDLIDRPMQDKWDLYFNSFELLRTSVPLIAIVGNHDYHKGLNKYPDERFFYTFPYFLDENDEVPSVGYSELDFGKTILYILDSNQPIWRQIGQQGWFESRLKKAGDKKKILALHHPLRSARGRFNNFIVQQLYESIVLEYNVELVLAGHEHTYHVLSAEETGGYEQIITNFSFKTYDEAEGNEDRKIVELNIEK